MSLFGPEYFKCKHEKLNKKKNSKNMYDCNQCNQTFMIIPLKHDPIYHDKPKFPDLGPDFPDYPELKDHPDFIR
jgi:hypothetical protein|tara:strand:+ start:3058 stop:3279 length:222 start_codon:yes stop_codon:yes gene_type:complete